jgi:hypothetical protein
MWQTVMGHVALDGVLVVSYVEGDGDGVLDLHGAFVIKPLNFVRAWMRM